MSVIVKQAGEDATQRIVDELSNESCIQDGVMCIAMFELFQATLLVPPSEHVLLEHVLSGYALVCVAVYKAAGLTPADFEKDFELTKSKISASLYN